LIVKRGNEKHVPRTKRDKNPGSERVNKYDTPQTSKGEGGAVVQSTTALHPEHKNQERCGFVGEKKRGPYNHAKRFPWGINTGATDFKVKNFRKGCTFGGKEKKPGKILK